MGEAKTPRGKLLEEAKNLIENDRNATYGPPTADFRRAAGILNAMGYRGNAGRDLLPHDIAVLVTAVKLSRLTNMPEHEDSYKDIAGYIGCGWECVTEETAKGELPLKPKGRSLGEAWVDVTPTTPEFRSSLTDSQRAIIYKITHTEPEVPWHEVDGAVLRDRAGDERDSLFWLRRNGGWDCWCHGQWADGSMRNQSFEYVESAWGPVEQVTEGPFPWELKDAEPAVPVYLSDLEGVLKTGAVLRDRTRDCWVKMDNGQWAMHPQYNAIGNSLAKISMWAPFTIETGIYAGRKFRLDPDDPKKLVWF